MIWQIASQTGWTVQYIMRSVNYQTLLMMLSDAPRYISVSGKDKKAKEEKKTAEGFFRSLMNNNK